MPFTYRQAVMYVRCNEGEEAGKQESCCQTDNVTTAPWRYWANAGPVQAYACRQEGNGEKLKVENDPPMLLLSWSEHGSRQMGQGCR